MSKVKREKENFRKAAKSNLVAGFGLGSAINFGAAAGVAAYKGKIGLAKGLAAGAGAGLATSVGGVVASAVYGTKAGFSNLQREGYSAEGLTTRGGESLKQIGALGLGIGTPFLAVKGLAKLGKAGSKAKKAYKQRPKGATVVKERKPAKDVNPGVVFRRIGNKVVPVARKKK
jgi:hypothetical protein